MSDDLTEEELEDCIESLEEPEIEVPELEVPELEPKEEIIKPRISKYELGSSPVVPKRRPDDSLLPIPIPDVDLKQLELLKPPASEHEFWALLNGHKKKSDDGSEIPDLDIKQVKRLKPPASKPKLLASLNGHKKKSDHGSSNIPDLDIKQVERLTPPISQYQLGLWLRSHNLESLGSLWHIPIPDVDLKQQEHLKPPAKGHEKKPKDGSKIPDLDIKQVKRLKPSVSQYKLELWLRDQNGKSLGSLLHVPIPGVDLKQLKHLKLPTFKHELWAFLKGHEKSDDCLKIPDLDIKQVERLMPLIMKFYVLQWLRHQNLGSLESVLNLPNVDLKQLEQLKLVTEEELWASLKAHEKKSDDGLNIPDLNTKQVEHLTLGTRVTWRQCLGLLGHDSSSAGDSTGPIYTCSQCKGSSSGWNFVRRNNPPLGINTMAN
ncbi:uncharacterized protein LOC117818636 [Notolabrus celidotus]|uniref:uncharacterized protein LOC117818636 n=1 Tax=Notolabrus celidotus TaxID=1203425 RepID=UPI00148FCD0B|nr:uncharacterized protein LOC117818636 [Notolabrus celidotus]